jgi:hypothetical protein
MKKLVFMTMAAVLTAVMLTAFKCGEGNEPEPNQQICGVDNPLTELEWLRTMVEFYADTVDYPMLAKIYKCKYADNQDGFLINGCIGCPDMATELYSCDGTLLCLMYGEDGINHCEEYQIDENSIELIFSNTNQ